MALLQLFTNNAISLLQAPISASSTTIILQPGLGAAFPLPANPGEFFLITLEDIAAPFNREIVKVTGRTGDTLTGCLRAEEGTTAQAWAALDTLVDHRITAETIKQAFLQPIAASGTIIGETSPPVVILSGQTLPGNVATYADTKRGFKFFVTLTMSATWQSQSFEVLGNVGGDLTTNSETVTFNRTSRVGTNFAGSLNLTLNTALKQVSLSWTNNEINPITIQCIRIQHAP